MECIVTQALIEHPLRPWTDSVRSGFMMSPQGYMLILNTFSEIPLLNLECKVLQALEILFPGNEVGFDTDLNGPVILFHKKHGICDA